MYKYYFVNSCSNDAEMLWGQIFPAKNHGMKPLKGLLMTNIKYLISIPIDIHTDKIMKIHIWHSYLASEMNFLVFICAFSLLIYVDFSFNYLNKPIY